MIFLGFLLTAICSAVSVSLHLWQWLIARKFPLEARNPHPSFHPAITLLKPLKGCDAETSRCLESWLTQSYPAPVQVLFGVASSDDPVCALVQGLLRRFPTLDARLVFCPDALGANAKVSTLLQLHASAQHEIIVISDADIRVPADFLAQMIAPLEQNDVGLVHCLYRAANPSTVPMRLEAIAINADFWSQVLQSLSLRPPDFALGATMATSRTTLQNMGGFAALLDYLADDYQLGNRIARLGKRLVLSTIVVEGWEAPMSWSQVWRHQLRWSRTFRFCTPGLYFLSILNNVTLWSLLLLLGRPTQTVLIFAAICWGLRIAIALHHQVIFTRSRESLYYGWLIPVKDLLGFVIWALAFLGNHVDWRGQRYRVLRDGKLVLVSPVK